MVSNLNLLESRRRILLTAPHLESPTPANPLTFKSNMTAKLKEEKVYFTPIQEGTGDPSPDNVRPILGWDGITVTKCGKNLVDIEDMKAKYPWSTASYKSYKVYVGPNRNVTVSVGSFPPGGKSFYFGISGIHQNSSDMTWMYHKTVPSYNKTSAKVTTDSKGYVYITLYAQNTQGLNDFYTYFLDNNFQVEFGEEATSYEPYVEPTKITIPFPKTIYGGYVDLVNGEVVEEWGVLDLGEVNWGTLSGNRARIVNFVSKYNTIESEYHSVPLAIAEKYVGRSASTVLKFSEFAITKNLTLYYDGENNPSGKIAYPLATPIHHTIGPQVIRPFKGVNNIWSDANGNIEIKFWKH